MTTTTLRTTTASAALLSIAMLLLACANATAQPIKPAYNIGQYEYWIGGYESPSHSDPDAIWPFMDSMGVTIPILGNLFPPLPSNPLGVLLDTSDQWWHTGRRFFPIGPPQAFLAGFGREVVFYPFDSVQATLWPSKFLVKSKGTTDTNFSERKVREQVYSLSSDLGEIASTIAINAASLSARTFQKNKKLLAEQHTKEDPSRCAYIVLTGHLFDSLNSSNNNAAVVFRVAVYHQLGPSDHYLRDNLTVPLTQPEFPALISLWIASPSLGESSWLTHSLGNATARFPTGQTFTGGHTITAQVRCTQANPAGVSKPLTFASIGPVPKKLPSVPSPSAIHSASLSWASPKTASPSATA